MLYQPHEEGQGLVEYALILVLVAVVVIVILALLGPAIGNIFSNVVSSL
jgi:pilus assembly protein Flp/PilA